MVYEGKGRDGKEEAGIRARSARCPQYYDCVIATRGAHSSNKEGRACLRISFSYSDGFPCVLSWDWKGSTHFR